MKKDLVIGIVGTLILLTAMVGVFRYESGQRGTGYDVAWPTRQVEAASVDGGTNEGETTEEALNLTALNATRVEFLLEWTDNVANSDPDEFTLTVTPPGGGQPKTVTGTAGPLSVVFENLTVVPEQIRLYGPNEDAVHAQAQRQYASTAAQGAWTVTVQLVQAGDLAGAPVAAGPLGDGGNDWTLRAVATVYEAQLTAA